MSGLMLSALGTLGCHAQSRAIGATCGLQEDMTAIGLIGKSQDTGKESTYGILAGKMVIVDYGWWIRPQTVR